MATAVITRAGNDDELALVSFEDFGDRVQVGEDVDVVDPRTGGLWQGTVVDVDDQLRCMYVKVDTDTFVPPTSFFEETGLEAQRDIFNLEDAADATDLDLFESKTSGRLYTLLELDRMLRVRRQLDDLFPLEDF